MIPPRKCAYFPNISRYTRKEIIAGSAQPMQLYTIYPFVPREMCFVLSDWRKARLTLFSESSSIPLRKLESYQIIANIWFIECTLLTQPPRGSVLRVVSYIWRSKEDLPYNDICPRNRSSKYFFIQVNRIYFTMGKRPVSARPRV